MQPSRARAATTPPGAPPRLALDAPPHVARVGLLLLLLLPAAGAPPWRAATPQHEGRDLQHHHEGVASNAMPSSAL